ncbi:MAG: hypothetical protein AB7V32_04835 [Candidatus Berkiella sp.]
MRKIVYLLTYSLLLSFCYPAIGTDATHKSTQSVPAAPNESASLPAEGNKKEWSLNIEQTLPGLLCDSKKYFVTCFDVTQQECTEYTQLLVRACLSNIQLALPQNIDKTQGEYWGKMVGKCSYDLYEKFMQPKKLPKPGCQTFSQNDDDLPPPSEAKP